MTNLRRLKKEFIELSTHPPPGIRLDESVMQENTSEWILHMEGAPSTLYEGENYRLLFKFNSKYPFDSPQVVFIKPSVPIHPHIYSNGHICLSILDNEWTPALNISAVCVSIQSMLSSCTTKVKPENDSMYVRFAPQNPKKTTWVFDDETV